MNKFIVILLLVCSNLMAADLNLNTVNTVVFRSQVNMDSVNVAQLQMQELVKLRGSRKYPIYLVLDCPGGGIMEGDSFIQYLKTVDNLQTVTIAAASMCAAIVQQVSGIRSITENGVLMFHRAKAGIEGYLNEGELEEQLRFIKSIVTNMEIKNSNRLKMSLEDYKKRVFTEWYIYGKEALTLNAADKLVDIRCSQDLIDKKETETVANMFGEFTFIFSACPLFRTPIGVGEEK